MALTHQSIETIKKGLLLTEARVEKMPDFDIYQSILRQLSYLLSVVDGSNPDNSNLGKIIVGHFAVREFEESDPELASILKKCQNIAFKLDMGS
ncbi:immunity protein Tsi6 family protein [Agaribacterium haliotis]|uniref:immunity protein Tsi6 family protein n=1 Tax=Agaribacterium haliotis TaxID=2013869 RepID=UPI000BB557BA|nr:immunity protein Tsi6 family protein [Agaribacterium haliotis]